MMVRFLCVAGLDDGKKMPFIKRMTARRSGVGVQLVFYRLDGALSR